MYTRYNFPIDMYLEFWYIFSLCDFSLRLLYVSVTSSNEMTNASTVNGACCDTQQSQHSKPINCPVFFHTCCIRSPARHERRTERRQICCRLTHFLLHWLTPSLFVASSCMFAFLRHSCRSLLLCMRVAASAVDRVDATNYVCVVYVYLGSCI